MKKRNHIEEMLDIKLKNDLKTPLHLQLYQAIKEKIIKGNIEINTRLPASRQLATQLHISRNTVQNAYAQLKAEGYLHSKVGSGIFVKAEIPDHYIKSQYITTAKPANNTKSNTKIVSGDFTPGIPDLKNFPHKLWQTISHKVLRQHYKKLLFANDPLGYQPLRKAIAHYLKYSRSVNCHHNQVIITAGAQEAISLSIQALLKPQQKIAIENPGYRGAILAAQHQQARIITIPMKASGLDIKGLTKYRPKLIYVTPSHQYPLGHTLPIEERLALIKFANTNNSYIIEDDYDSEYHYQVKPLPSLQGLDSQQRVIYLGTFSKTLFPAIRLGFLVLPENLVPLLEKFKLASCGQTTLINQAILAEFIQSGHFARHIKRMRLHYAEKYKLLINACEKHLPNNIIVYKNSVGLHITLNFNDLYDDEQLLKTLHQKNLFPMPLSRYYHNSKKQSGLVLGFGNTALSSIEKNIIKLADCLK